MGSGKRWSGPPPSRPLEPSDAAIIANSGFFKGLPEAALKDVVAVARRVTFRQAQYLFRLGDRADAVYLLLSGRARMLQSSAEGQSVALRVLGPGELLGLVAALGEEHYPASAQAQQLCTAARWSGSVLWPLVEQHPSVATAALKMALARLRQMQEQYRELATERVEQRIARALVRLVRQAGKRVDEGVRIDMPLTRQDLAEMTGTTLYTVSRTLTAWADEGVLMSKRSEITILRPHALVARAEDLPDRE